MSAKMEGLLTELAELLERYSGSSIGIAEDGHSLTVLMPDAIDPDETEACEIPITIDALTIAHAIEDAEE